MKKERKKNRKNEEITTERVIVSLSLVSEINAALM